MRRHYERTYKVLWDPGRGPSASLGSQAIPREKAGLSQDPKDHKRVGVMRGKGQVGETVWIPLKEGEQEGKQRLWPEGVSQEAVTGGGVGRRYGATFRENPKLPPAPQPGSCQHLGDCLTEAQEPKPRHVILAWETQPHPLPRGWNPGICWEFSYKGSHGERQRCSSCSSEGHGRPGPRLPGEVP